MIWIVQFFKRSKSPMPHAFLFIMKKISEVEEKPLTSSSNICPEDCCRKRGGAGGVTPPPHPILFLSWSEDVSFKDDVTVILLRGISFMVFCTRNSYLFQVFKESWRPFPEKFRDYPRPPFSLMLRKEYFDSRQHRVDSVLSFFSSRRNWDSPTPLAQGECVLTPPPLPHPLVRWGRAHSLGGEGLGESQFRRRNLHCGALYI